MESKNKEYNVIKSFRDTDGAVYFPGDTVKTNDDRAAKLRACKIIGGTVQSASRGFLEKANVQTDYEKSLQVKATEKATKNKAKENRAR